MAQQRGLADWRAASSRTSHTGIWQAAPRWPQEFISNWPV